jgi:hypothetical protein
MSHQRGAVDRRSGRSATGVPVHFKVAAGFEEVVWSSLSRESWSPRLIELESGLVVASVTEGLVNRSFPERVPYAASTMVEIGSVRHSNFDRDVHALASQLPMSKLAILDQLKGPFRTRFMHEGRLIAVDHAERRCLRLAMLPRQKFGLFDGEMQPRLGSC